MEKKKVQITPEMLAAGEFALLDFSLDELAKGWLKPSELVRAIYESMAENAPQQQEAPIAIR